MDEQGLVGAAALMEEEGALSRAEWKIEQEKVRLERERLALERERLEVMRERVRASADGRMAVRLSSVVLCSIICLLVGGIFGAFSMSVRHDRRGAARLQEVMRSLGTDAAAVGAEGAEEDAVVRVSPSQAGVSNAVAAVVTPPVTARPLRVKTVRPPGSDSGISVILVQ